MRQGRSPPPAASLVAGRPKLSKGPGDIHVALEYAMDHHIPLEEAVKQLMRVQYPFIDWESGHRNLFVVRLMDAFFMVPLRLHGYPYEGQ